MLDDKTYYDILLQCYANTRSQDDRRRILRELGEIERNFNLMGESPCTKPESSH